MANILGTLRVRLTAESSDFRRGLADAKKNLGSFQKSLSSFRTNTLAGVASIGALGAALKSAIGVADQYDNAQRQLAATAKLTGTELGALQSISKGAQSQFKLSEVTANAFTIELSKLAQKAGDVGKASAGLEAFLDIGAARGLSASDTLQAVRQAILGIDEGTDKLFGKNPSVLYKEYADKIGTSVGKLSDQQKAQALLNAAMEDGQKVRGEYSKWLETSQGQQYLLGQSIEKTQAAVGKALQPALVAIIPIISKLADWTVQAIRGFQMLGATLALVPGMVASAKAAMSGGLKAGREEWQRWVDAWKESIAEIQSASQAVYTPPLLETGSASSQTSTAGEAPKGKKDTPSEAELAEQERRNILLNDAIEKASILNQVALARLGTEASLTDKLRLQLDFTEREYELRRAAILENVRLSEAERQNELLKLDLAHQREETQLRLNAAVEQELSVAARARREAEKKRQAEEKARQESERAVAKTSADKQRRIDAAKDKAGDVLSGIVGSAISGNLSGGQVGAGIGSVLGSLIPIPFAGSLLSSIGGALGGLLGKKKREPDVQPVIKGLDAIERAQRETISTIQAQTEALLRPENRLLNLPSGFNAPAYSPGLGRSSSAPSVTYGDTHVSLNLSITTQQSPDDIKRLAMEGVEEALTRSRRNESWTSSRY